jgi:hypothetical protein
MIPLFSWGQPGPGGAGIAAEAEQDLKAQCAVVALIELETQVIGWACTWRRVSCGLHSPDDAILSNYLVAAGECVRQIPDMLNVIHIVHQMPAGALVELWFQSILDK